MSGTAPGPDDRTLIARQSPGASCTAGALAFTGRTHNRLFRYAVWARVRASDRGVERLGLGHTPRCDATRLSSARLAPPGSEGFAKNSVASSALRSASVRPRFVRSSFTSSTDCFLEARSHHWSLAACVVRGCDSTKPVAHSWSAMPRGKVIVSLPGSSTTRQALESFRHARIASCTDRGVLESAAMGLEKGLQIP